MKYCRDCHWYGVNSGSWLTRFLYGLLPRWVWNGEVKCFHPDSVSRHHDPVTGRRTMTSIDSAGARRNSLDGSCGTDGKQFEPAQWVKPTKEGGETNDH